MSAGSIFSPFLLLLFSSNPFVPTSLLESRTHNDRNVSTSSIFASSKVKKTTCVKQDECKGKGRRRKKKKKSASNSWYHNSQEIILESSEHVNASPIRPSFLPSFPPASCAPFDQPCRRRGKQRVWSISM